MFDKVTPATENPDWGFWGAMKDQASKAWPIAIRAIVKATCEDKHAVRSFLDSRYGRHFGDDVLNELQVGHPLQKSVEEATARWMSWKIGKATSRQYDIPRGTAYLTGFVVHCSINDEASCVA